TPPTFPRKSYQTRGRCCRGNPRRADSNQPVRRSALAQCFRLESTLRELYPLAEKLSTASLYSQIHLASPHLAFAHCDATEQFTAIRRIHANHLPHCLPPACDRSEGHRDI